MDNEILIYVKNDEKRIALLEDGELAEYYVEKKDAHRMLGNIYKAKVECVLSGMQCAFVDIGFDKNAFLYINDAVNNYDLKKQKINIEFVKKYNTNISDIIKQGQEIIVQVMKEAAGSKGPRVTRNIAIPGRYAALIPDQDYIGVSSKIKDENIRFHLKSLADKIKPEGMGIIMRTNSQYCSETEIINDVNVLKNLWDNIKRNIEKQGVPSCVYEEIDMSLKTVRDFITSDVKRIVVNDRQEYDKLVEFANDLCPMMKNKIQLYNKDYDMFEFYNINSMLLRATARKVWLKSGGYVVVDRAEALTVFDVNSGKYTGKNSLEATAVKTNLQAVDEIARQIRLRDIGGIIIIDFIDMTDENNKQLVLSALKKAVQKDRTKTSVVGFTSLGLVEMTRKKTRKELISVISKTCPHCKGTGRLYEE